MAKSKERQLPAETTVAALLYARTNQEVMEALGVSEDTASRWRTGRSVPSARYIRPIAQWLGVDEAVISADILRFKGHQRPTERGVA